MVDEGHFPNFLKGDKGLNTLPFISLTKFIIPPIEKQIHEMYFVT